MQLTLATAAALFVIASVANAATVAQVKDDITAIDTAVQNLNSHAQTDSLNYFSGLAIRHAADEVIAKIKQGSTDVHALEGAPTDAEAKEIITMLTGTQTKVKSTVDRMVALKPEFEKLGVLALSAKSVNEFKDETSNFSAELVRAAPASQKSEANKLASKFNQNLAMCADAYKAYVIPHR